MTTLLLRAWSHYLRLTTHWPSIGTVVPFIPLIVAWWLVDPARQTVTIYRSLTETEQLTATDTITAEPVLPGFSVPVSRFF